MSSFFKSSMTLIDEPTNFGAKFIVWTLATKGLGKTSSLRTRGGFKTAGEAGNSGVPTSRSISSGVKGTLPISPPPPRGGGGGGGQRGAGERAEFLNQAFFSQAGT